MKYGCTRVNAILVLGNVTKRLLCTVMTHAKCETLSIHCEKWE